MHVGSAGVETTYSLPVNQTSLQEMLNIYLVYTYDVITGTVGVAGGTLQLNLTLCAVSSLDGLCDVL